MGKIEVSFSLKCNYSNHPEISEKKRVLSGVQPTGSLHLGNYLGAIRQWVKFQEELSLKGDENFFCVVDLYANTMSHNPDELKEST